MNQKLIKSTSFIEPHEEEEAKRFVESILGKNPIKVTGYNILVKVQIRDSEIKKVITNEGKEVSLLMSDKTTEFDRYQNCVGLVIGMGQQAYKGKQFENEEPWCKVGDWVIIPRNDGPNFMYKGQPAFIVPDDRVLAVIYDPDDVNPFKRSSDFKDFLKESAMEGVEMEEVQEIAPTLVSVAPPLWSYEVVYELRTKTRPDVRRQDSSG